MCSRWEIHCSRKTLTTLKRKYLSFLVICGLIIVTSGFHTAGLLCIDTISCLVQFCFPNNTKDFHIYYFFILWVKISPEIHMIIKNSFPTFERYLYKHLHRGNYRYVWITSIKSSLNAIKDISLRVTAINLVSASSYLPKEN